MLTDGTVHGDEIMRPLKRIMDKGKPRDWVDEYLQS